MEMKQVMVLFLVVMMVSSSFAVLRREVLGGVSGQEQRQHAEKGKAVEGQKGKAYYPEQSIDNHHSIPRQYYNDWGGSSHGDNGNNGDDGNG